MKPKALYICGGTLALIGIILAAGGPLFFMFGFHSIVKKGVSDYIVVDSTSSDSYSDWVVDTDVKVPFYLVYYMWNLTNPQDVLAGKNPIYDKVGPYTYRRYKTKMDVQFSDDGDEVQFSPQRLYYFDANQSAPGLQETDLIHNINPAYVGAASIAGSEQGLQFGAAAFFLAQFASIFSGPFVEMYLSYSVPSRLSYALNVTVTTLAPEVGGVPAAYAYFYDAWANKTIQPSQQADWTGLQVSRDSIPTNLSVSTVEQLFNPSMPFSLTNTTSQATNTWLFATQNLTNARAVLMQTFHLSEEQLDLLLLWRNNSFLETRVIGYLMDHFNLKNIRDVGLLQWGSGTPLGQSVVNVFPELNFMAEPEYIFFTAMGAPVPLDVDTVKVLLFGPYGLTTIAGLQDFMMNGPNDPSLWGLDDNSAGAVGTWFGLYLVPNFVNVTFEQIFQSGTGGLIVHRSVNEWLFTCTDPILALVQPQNNNCGLLPNNTIELPSLVKTGAGNLDEIGLYVKWQNTTEVDFWARPVPVNGTTEDGQFAPFLSSDQPLSVWEEQMVRNVPLVQIGETEVFDITLHRYALTNATFIDPNPLYYQNITGFINATALKQVPAFMSNWDMWGAPEKYRAKVGITTQNASADLTFISVEPITGKVMKASKRLQVNIFLPPGVGSTWFSMYYPGVTTDIFYPIASAMQTSEITQELADEWHNKVGLALKLKMILFWVTLGVGIFLTLVGAAIVGFTWRSNRNHDGYHTIQN